MSDEARDWIPTNGPTAREPEDGRRVDWIAPGGEVVVGGRFGPGRLWFLPGGEMYVYFTPPFWRPSEGS